MYKQIMAVEIMDWIDKMKRKLKMVVKSVNLALGAAHWIFFVLD